MTCQHNTPFCIAIPFEAFCSWRQTPLKVSPYSSLDCVKSQSVIPVQYTDIPLFAGPVLLSWNYHTYFSRLERCFWLGLGCANVHCCYPSYPIRNCLMFSYELNVRQHFEILKQCIYRNIQILWASTQSDAFLYPFSIVRVTNNWEE